MLSIRKINPMVRAIGTMGAIAATVGVVTLAAQTTNTVALTDNNITVTNDVLRISNGGAFSTSVTGFSNTNLVVGNEGPKNAFYFQNLANANLVLSANIPGGPLTPNLNPTGIHIKIYDKDSTTLLMNKTFAELEALPQTVGDVLEANAQGNGGVAGTEGNYFYSVTVDAAAVIDNPATVPSFDLNFAGTTT